MSPKLVATATDVEAFEALRVDDASDDVTKKYCRQVAP